MKRLNKPSPPKKQKPTHLMVLLDPIDTLPRHTIVNGWENRVHGQLVCWFFNHPAGRVVRALPCQIKIIKPIKRRAGNATKNTTPLKAAHSRLAF